MNDYELTLLSIEQQMGVSYADEPLDVLKKAEKETDVTDLCILTGCSLRYWLPNSSSKKTANFWTKSYSGYNSDYVKVIDGEDGYRHSWPYNSNSCAIRPVLKSVDIIPELLSNKTEDSDEVEYGQYPQYAVNSEMQDSLEEQMKLGNLKETGKTYTFNSEDKEEFGFNTENYVEYAEYEYNEKKYVRVKANLNIIDSDDTYELTNGVRYKKGDYVWVEVSPVKWLVDDKTKTLISKNGLVSGVSFKFNSRYGGGDFKNTEVKEYLDNYMKKDLFYGISLSKTSDISKEEQKKRLEELKASISNQVSQDIVETNENIGPIKK